jgi:hypothetical protein
VKIKFTNPDPRDFPTLGLVDVKAGDTANVPAVVAHDLAAQGVAVPTQKTTAAVSAETEE